VVGERACGGVAEWRTVPMEMTVSAFRVVRLRWPGRKWLAYCGRSRASSGHGRGSVLGPVAARAT
jgi:hypothetical protein